MKNGFVRKALCVLLVCVLAASSALFAFAGTPAEDAHLQFDVFGNFRILNFSDFQDDTSLDSRTKSFIRRAVYISMPDVIVLTGDNIYGPDVSSGSTRTAIAEFMDIFEELGVPVAIVFGNHDDESAILSSSGPLSKERQMEIYNSYNVDISYDEGSSMSGCGTYNIPIYGSTEVNKVKFNLWMIDTGSVGGRTGNYDGMRQNQIDWYKTKSNELKAANGGVPVKSIAFQHIIVREIFSALDYNGSSYSLPSTAAPGSILGETPCPTDSSKYYNEFSNMKSQGDVLAIVSGHDHKNMFVVPYQGIDLINTPAAGYYSAWGYSGDSASRGARVLDVDEQTSAYTTHMINLEASNQTDYSTKSGSRVSINVSTLRQTCFAATRKLKDDPNKYTPESWNALVNAVQQTRNGILSDLKDDHTTALYDQSDVTALINLLNSCMNGLSQGIFTITLDPNGGTCRQQTVAIELGIPVLSQLPTATRPRYAMTGWFTAREGGERIDEDTFFTQSSPSTLYAHWSLDGFWIAGDADGNDVRDLRDVTAIMRYLAGGFGVTIDFDHADVNWDGVVNLRDAALLRRYIADWAVDIY